MLRIIAIAFLLTLAVDVASAQMPKTKSAAGATVYIIAPQNGEEITGPVTVKFGLQGMGVAPAGVEYPESGHHHLLINADALPPMDQPIPADDHHVHFGKGQTETVLDLDPGTYTLQLILGDQNHIPHDPPVVSERITIVVK
jgi:hypothetical protein